MVSVYLVKFEIDKVRLYRHGRLSLICRIHIETRTIKILEYRLFPVEIHRPLIPDYDAEYKWKFPKRLTFQQYKRSGAWFYPIPDTHEQSPQLLIPELRKLNIPIKMRVSTSNQ